VKVVAVGASTGGPPAVQRLLEALSGHPVCLLVVQHMPPRFTRAFAERLDRIGSFRVREAEDGDRVEPGRVLIAPGGRQMVLVVRSGALTVRTPLPGPEDRHVPSVNHLFDDGTPVGGNYQAAAPGALAGPPAPPRDDLEDTGDLTECFAFA